MRKFRSQMENVIVGPVPQTATLFFLIVAAFFLPLTEAAHAQIWVSSGFAVTPDGKNEIATCSTSALNPTTSQPSLAAADYNMFLASCSVTPSDGSPTITSAQCPGGASGSVFGYPYGNPTGQCAITFQPQPNVTYTLNSTHAIEFNLVPGLAYCGQWEAPYGVCFSDPLGYFSYPWPAIPTYAGVISSSSAPAINAVDNPCSASGTCAPQNIPAQVCQSSVFGICGIMIENPEYWDLARTLEPWQIRCSDVLNGAVTHTLGGAALSLSGGATGISATFMPNFGLTLAQAAQVCGYLEFDWRQTITSLPLPNPFKAAGSDVSLYAPPSFNDPPPQGYAYDNPPSPAPLPLYYSPFTGANDPYALTNNETEFTLTFYDSPADNCLPGGTGASCNGSTAPAGSMLGFTTHLVGIQGDLPGAAVIDTGIGFSWTSTFNGTSGGISIIRSNGPIDSGSGTGGITITASSDTTNYELGITTPPTQLYEDQISTTGSGLAYSRVSKMFVGTMTITNVSENTITGPFQIVLDSLTTGITLSNSTGSFGGWPYLTIQNVTSLEPGQSATVNVRFSNPTYGMTDFNPVVYSGSFD